MTTTTVRRYTLGSPQTAGPLAVFPIFGPEPRWRYRSLAQASARGAFVAEVDDHGSVNDVLVANITDEPLLLYEGEVILGARQNRAIDAPVLVPAYVQLSVSVSCIEQGRWETGKRRARFTLSPNAIDPALRRTKRASANTAASPARRRAPSRGRSGAKSRGGSWHTRSPRRAPRSPTSLTRSDPRSRRSPR